MHYISLTDNTTRLGNTKIVKKITCKLGCIIPPICNGKLPGDGCDVFGPTAVATFLSSDDVDPPFNNIHVFEY